MRSLGKLLTIASFAVITFAASASAQSYLGVIDRSPIVEIRGETADTSQLGTDRFVQDNLDYLLANHEWVAVNFSAYWCGDSRVYRPDFDSVAAMPQFGGICWAYADVDVTVGNESFRKRFDLPGVPVTILFHNGEIVEESDSLRSVLDGHKGDKDIDDLLGLLKRFYKSR
jgi:thiol:disulfide interchange protein